MGVLVSEPGKLDTFRGSRIPEWLSHAPDICV